MDAPGKANEGPRCRQRQMWCEELARDGYLSCHARQEKPGLKCAEFWFSDQQFIEVDPSVR